jgi:predicted MPP superfamily phosphohydrolase
LVTGLWVTVDLGDGTTLQIGGDERPWGPGPDHPPKPPATATIVLSHTPDNFYRLARSGVTAVFSGHTHGGQYRLPGIGSLVVPGRLGRQFDRGHFRIGGTHLFVSAGVGADAGGRRLWCPPDVLVVDFAD